MKKKITILSLTLATAILFPISLIAASIEVSWNANTEPDLAGYKIYYGTQSGTYTSTVNTGKVTTMTIDNLETGKTYYVAMSAYDTSANESEKSAEVSVSIPVPDTIPPTGSITINAGAATASSRTVTLSLSATDNAGTIAGMMISNDGVTWSSEAAFSASQAWVLTEGDGIKTVYAKFKDSNGNWMTTPVSDTITLLLDSDNDGMPDVWENTNGLNPNNASDAGLDSDGDGYNNLEEYVNNSNPNYKYDYAPTVEAGANQQSDPTRIYLNGSATDPNGDIITYSWSLVSGPVPVTIDNATSSRASFLGVKSGTYRFMLTCSDARSSSTDTVDIKINNVAPNVNAGSDMTVDSGTTITLHSVGSDPNDDALVYTWSLLEGPGIALPSMTTQDIVITPQNAGLYRFAVVCSDGVNSSQADEVLITVNAVNRAPTADAGADIDVQSGTVVTLDGSGSSDPDNDTLTYTWTQVSGTRVQLTNATSAKASFTASATGTYVFELIVSDSKVSSTPDTVTVRVLKQNTAPVAEAGDDQDTKVGTLVSLDAGASYDPDADALTFTWSQISGASVEMTGANTARMTFTPTVSGVLEFKVTVSDGQAKAEDTVKVTVESVNHVPVADAGEPQTVNLTPTLGLKVTLDGRGSWDADGNTLSYIWSQISGPSVSLSGANTATPSFTPGTAGTYVFELKVYDGKDTSLADTVTITVQNIQTSIKLTAPLNGAQISSAPTLKWTGANMTGYGVYIALDGKNYVMMYSGSSTSYTIHSVLWYWFIPKNTMINWYVVGQSGSSQAKSTVFTFKKV
ncbi:MAG TPA: PKD domain-containing protein [Desulfomonilia bacterium]